MENIFKPICLLLKNISPPDRKKEQFFDNLDNAEKEKVIEPLHATWSAPENEVVKRLAQFKEKSPEILKPILES